MATFPGPGSNALGVKVELLLNGTWTDATSNVRLRNPLQITNMGRADWTSSLQAAQLTLTLNNRDGRFSPKNTAGAYYPYITRNVQVRVSVNAQSVTAVNYSGYRFFGEVADWPPRWDPSGRDVWCDITAAGIWQRMSQLTTTLGSAYRRYYANQAGIAAPRAYWPMEDGTGSTGLIPYASAAGTGPGTWAYVAGQAGLSLAASNSFPGSDAIPQLNASAITFTVPAGGTATNNLTRFLLSVPAAGDSASGTANWNLLEVDSAGTVAKFEVYLQPNGLLNIQLRNSGGTVIASGTTTTNVKGQPYLVSAELAPSGGNVLFALSIIKPGAGTITETISGTLTTATVGAVSSVKISRAMTLMDTAIGHLAVFYGTPPTLVSSAYPLNGYAGEKAMDRFTRICGEMGITAETIGTASATAAMGPQMDDTLGNVLQMCEDTDCGLLYESRGQFGLGYRSNASMANQSAAATFSYTAALLDPSLAPAYDQQLTRNNVTVTNWTGYTQGAILTAGAMSVLNPPNGIGNGYNYQRNVSAAADSQLPGIANWLLNVGSVDEVRFPVVTLKQARAANAAQFAAVPGLRVGDYFQITNPPSFLVSTTVKQLVWGYSETLGVNEWTFAFNTVPETPWETGFSPGTVQLAQLPGGSVTYSAAPGAGGSVIANGSITPAMLSQGITVHTLGGNAITISASAPPTPNTSDIWIASATGLISQWSGSAWTPYKFDGGATIIANTIGATQIIANSIGAAQLAAGIIYATIVDGTTITGATIIDTGGGYFGYNGTPAFGNLFFSSTDASSIDAHGNAYLTGVTFYGNPSSGVWIAVNLGVTNSAFGLNYYTATGAGGTWGIDSWLRRTGVANGQLEIGPIAEFLETSLLPTTPAAGNKLWVGSTAHTLRVMKQDGEPGYGIGETIYVLPGNQTISAGWAVALANGGTSLSVPVVSGQQYYFEVVIECQAGGTGTTARVGVTGPSVSQANWYSQWVSGTAFPLTSSVGSNFQTTLTYDGVGIGTASEVGIYRASGSFTPSANGTFSAAAGESGAVSFSVLAGSYLKVRTVH